MMVLCANILIDAKLKTRKRGQKTSDWEKSIRRQRSTFDFIAI
jgi:hypothetical protein